MLSLNDLKLYYLEKIKEIDPEYYSDIDKLIEETRKAIEDSTKPLQKWKFNKKKTRSGEDNFPPASFIYIGWDGRIRTYE